MKALIITSAKDHPLFRKLLFQILEFSEEEIIWADPEKEGFSLRSAPDVIIPVGQKALDKIEPGLSITKTAGDVLDYNDVPVVPVFAPGYIDKNSHLFRRWAEDFYRAYQVMCGIEELTKSNQRIIVEDATILMDLIDNIKKAGYVAFDFESTSLTELKHHDPDFYLTMMTLTFQQGSSYIIPMYHEESTLSKEFLELCRDELEKEVFLNPDVTKIGQNVKFDIHCLVWWGITDIKGPVHDTMVMHHLLDEHSKHNLKEMVRMYHPRYSDYEKELGSFKNWADIPLDTLMKYGALDSDLTFRLYWQFTQLLLDEDERLYILFRNLSAPATVALWAMERDGMLINKEYLLESIEKVKVMIEEVEAEMRGHVTVMKFQQKRVDKAFEQHMDDLAAKMEKLEGKEFKSEQAQRNNVTKINGMAELLEQYGDGQLKPEDWLKPEQYKVNFASSHQMVELFYGLGGFCFEVPDDQYGRPQRSTGKDVLDLLKDKSGFVDNLLALRQLKKVLSTYLEGILIKMDSKHRIHGTYNQNGTKTGRLSASDPNLQNIIKRTKYKRVEEAVSMVMKCFSVPDGGYMMQADFSQAELRLIAHYAKESNMLEAYNNGEDLHALTAAITMGISLEKFKALPDKKRKMGRFQAKSVNFGYIYGMSAEGFKEYARTSYSVEMSLKKARDVRQKFFEKYPKLLDYHKTYIAKAKKYGYVRTLFGQKMRLPDIYSTDRQKQGHAERNAINGPIQGTAGQMMIFAIGLLYHRAPYLMNCNTVHDSLDTYTHDPKVSSPIIKETMENLPMMEYFGKTVDSVKMVVDFEVSQSSWGELQEV